MITQTKQCLLEDAQHIEPRTIKQKSMKLFIHKLNTFQEIYIQIQIWGYYGRMKQNMIDQYIFLHGLGKAWSVWSDYIYRLKWDKDEGLGWRGYRLENGKVNL